MEDNIRFDVMERFFRGEWVECELVQEVFGVTFRQGYHLFEFGRIASWNPAPLNGQKVTCKFRIRRDLVDTNFMEGL